MNRYKERVNNLPVDLVMPMSYPGAGLKKTCTHAPHLDPQLQWNGKAKHTSFEVPTVFLHIKVRIDPHTIIEAVHKKKSQAGATGIVRE